MKICPKAGSLKSCPYCFHSTPHNDDAFCNEIGAGRDNCPKCVDIVDGKKNQKKVITHDQENIIKSIDTANLLCSDLQALVKSDNIYLHAIALDLMQKVVEVESKLKQIKE